MSRPAVRVDLEAQLACARRELALRAQVYPGFVERQKMSQAAADREQAAMASIVANLEFQLKYAEAFRRLARELIAAERSPEAAAVREAFPGATIADVRDT